ncbi:MAG TPA: sigma-70 family RNA polymerase sigma factor [Pirellulales bacterium]
MNAPEPELLGQLLDRHAPALVLFARQWCATPEDVIQEAFVRLAAQAQCPNDPVAWLYKVVRNGAISAARSQGRRRRHEVAAAEQAGQWFDERPEAALDAQTASAALAELPADTRELIVAHLWGDLTFAQIAELVGSPSSTVHRKYQAGLATLRNLLGEPVR